MTGDEVAPPRGVDRDLVERPPARLCRADDHHLPDEDPRPRGGRDASECMWPQPPLAHERIREEERDRAEGEMHLTGERDRRERRPREDEPPFVPAPRTLERPQRER